MESSKTSNEYSKYTLGVGKRKIFKKYGKFDSITKIQPSKVSNIKRKVTVTSNILLNNNIEKII